MSFVKDLDMPLLGLPGGQSHTLRDFCGGVHAFGGIGSGKTSGLHVLAGAFLRGGMGGLTTAVKSEDVDLWRRYAAEHGRGNSLVLFDENEGFNFLDYELARQGMDGIGTVTEMLMHLLEIAKRASPTASQRGGEEFWQDAMRQTLRRLILPLYAAAGSLSVADMTRSLSTAPTNLKEPTDPEWQRRSFFYKVMDAAARYPRVPMSRATLADTIRYWAEEWPAIPDKTRGNIVITITAALDRFRHGRLQRAFCGKTTIVPELSFHGGIIVLAMPTLVWNEDGGIAQQLFKYMWQRAVLSRNSLAPKHRERPVFLWCDEAQETVNSYDFEFQSLCRASKCCSVYITQSLPTYYAKMGGDSPRDAAEALVGKFMNHLYFTNLCPCTNEYASRVIGKVVMRRGNYNSGSSKSVNVGMSAGENENDGSSSGHGFSWSSSSGHGGGGGNANYGHTSGSGNNWASNRGRGTSHNVSQGYHESMEAAIEAGYFASGLKTGGPLNGNEITAIWFQAGRTFRASGHSWFLARFRQ